MTTKMEKAEEYMSRRGIRKANHWRLQWVIAVAVMDIANTLRRMEVERRVDAHT
jgi:hypothetical protein